jgi:hypothetical protein
MQKPNTFGLLEYLIVAAILVNIVSRVVPSIGISREDRNFKREDRNFKRRG